MTNNIPTSDVSSLVRFQTAVTHFAVSRSVPIALAVFFSVGLAVFDDYGIWIDDPYLRDLAIMTVNYILGILTCTHTPQWLIC